MFDLFGSKEKKENKRLNAVIAAKDKAISGLRSVSENLRARVWSHGMTDAEKLFIEECRDIFKNGKMISERKFKLRVSEINKMREDMK